jgi:glyoxylase-like metal-dependent hydrolase (beta-lactamase superfamily II)
VTIGDIAPWTDLGAGVTQIRLPMTGNPLRYVNGYLIDDDGWTLVDCGWRADDVLAALEAALAVKGLRVADLRRVVITHHHFDHYGLAATLRRAGAAELHMHRLDWERAQRFARAHDELDRLSDAWLARNGYVVEPGLDDTVARHAELAEPTHLVEDGDHVGRLLALWTPGHAPGHLCFLDPATERVPITPHVGVWYDGAGDPLGDDFRSLDRIAALGVDAALPAHGEPFAGLPARAHAIAAHTRAREALVVAALADGPRTAGEVAAAIPWTRRERHFASLDPWHRQFAVSETIAHLEHLRLTGRAVRHEDDTLNRYART